MAMKRFKNGNIHFKLDGWDFINENESDCINFIQLHEELLLIGDEFCISNWEMGFLLYDWYSDSFYMISFTDCEKFMQGKTVKLIGEEPDAAVYEYLRHEYDFAV